MKFGVIHYNAPGDTVAEFLDWAAETGFEYVELRQSDLWPEDCDNPHAEAEKVMAMMQERGIKASAVSVGNDFVVLDPDEIAYQMAQVRIVCEVAQIVGTNVLRTEGGQPKDEVPEDRQAEAIIGCCRQALEFVEPMGMKLAIDNHGMVSNNIPLLLEVIRTVDSPCVGSNLDTMNVRWYGWTVEECDQFYPELAPYVMHTHLKDGTGSRDKYVGAALGEGEIHLDYAVGQLQAACYDGVWCAEYEGQEETGLGYTKCLNWMQANIK